MSEETEFKPHEVQLEGDMVGTLFVVPVQGQGLQPIAAVSLEHAQEIAKLAYPRCAVGKGGFAKNRPSRGEQVWFQTLPVRIEPDKTPPKDLAEAERRGGLNFERRAY